MKSLASPVSESKSGDTGDFIESLGGVVLDHRFLRLTNRLLDEARTVFERRGLEFGPKWVSTFQLLAREPGLGVSEVARRLRLSHPAIIQITRAMARAGLVREGDDPDDGRRRLLFLTEEAEELRPEFDRLCDALGEVQVEIFREAGCDILAVLDRVGEKLRERSVADRVLERLDE